MGPLINPPTHTFPMQITLHPVNGHSTGCRSQVSSWPPLFASNRDAKLASGPDRNGGNSGFCCLHKETKSEQQSWSGTLHHLMGNFSLDQTLKSVCNHRTKGCAVHPLGPHLPCTYGRCLPIGNVMTTFLTNLGALGRATAGWLQRGRWGWGEDHTSRPGRAIEVLSRNTKVRLVCG